MKKSFDINNDIYPENFINQSISDFKDISDIGYDNNILEITGDSESEIEEIFNEFMNYTLGLINE